MAATRETLERQLARAKDKLSQWVKTLDERGVSAETRRRDPIWRELNADCRQLGRRLRAFDAVVALDAELKERKNQPEVEEEAAPAPKTEKKPSKAKAKAK